MGGPPWEEVLGAIDLLENILLPLPAKELLKFKCVSKLWLSVISNPNFCRGHVLRHQSPHIVPSALLFSGDYRPSPYFEIVPLDKPEDGNHSSVKVPNFHYLDVSCAMILRSCNGLLLCSGKLIDALRCDYYSKRRKISEVEDLLVPFRRDSCAIDVYGFRYFICNPTTKQLSRIPIPNWEIPKNYDGSLLSLYLAFEPFKCPTYKVISLRHSVEHPVDLRIDIYSSETRFWSDTNVSFTPPHGMGISAGVFCNGAIHWYSDDDYSFYFHVEGQCLKTMPMPLNKYGHARQIGYFGESRGHLHIILLPEHALEFNILEMEHDYSGWSVRYQVNLHVIIHSYPELTIDKLFSVMCVVRQEGDDDSVIVLLIRGKVVSYNLRHQTFKELEDLEPYGIVAASKFINGFDRLEHNHSGVFQCFESLSVL